MTTPLLPRFQKLPIIRHIVWWLGRGWAFDALVVCHRDQPERDVGALLVALSNILDKQRQGLPLDADAERRKMLAEYKA